MTSRSFVRVVGVVSLAVGVLGFFPGLKSPPPLWAPHLAANGEYGLLFGLFPVNWIHNLVHLIIGIAAWRASNTMSDARKFARGLAILYGGLAVMGVIPMLNSTFGLFPLRPRCLVACGDGGHRCLLRIWSAGREDGNQGTVQKGGLT